jgi:hypothetical protein
MRDIGILVWFVLLFVGVIGSMVSRIRSQRRMETQPKQTPQRLQPRRAQPQPVPTMQPPLQSPKPAALRSPSGPPSSPPAQGAPDTVLGVAPARRNAVRRLFGDRRDLVRAVIAAEVLGKPRGLGDEYPRA